MARLILFIGIPTLLVVYTYLCFKVGYHVRRNQDARQVLRRYGLTANSAQQLEQAREIFSDLLYFDLQKSEDDILTEETKDRITQWKIEHTEQTNSLRGNL